MATNSKLTALVSALITCIAETVSIAETLALKANTMGGILVDVYKIEATPVACQKRELTLNDLPTVVECIEKIERSKLPAYVKERIYAFTRTQLGITSTSFNGRIILEGVKENKTSSLQKYASKHKEAPTPEVISLTEVKEEEARKEIEKKIAKKNTPVDTKSLVKSLNTLNKKEMDADARLIMDGIMSLLSMKNRDAVCAKLIEIAEASKPSADSVKETIYGASTEPAPSVA